MAGATVGRRRPANVLAPAGAIPIGEMIQAHEANMPHSLKKKVVELSFPIGIQLKKDVIFFTAAKQ